MHSDYYQPRALIKCAPGAASEKAARGRLLLLQLTKHEQRRGGLDPFGGVILGAVTRRLHLCLGQSFAVGENCEVAHFLQAASPNAQLANDVEGRIIDSSEG